MKGKLLFVAGAAVGYVLGTRAGRQRYEQIKQAAESVWNTPVVQQGVDQVKGFAAERVGTVSDAIFDGAKKLVKSATNQSQQAKPQAKSTSTATAKAEAAAKAASTSAAEAAESAADAKQASTSTSKD